MNPFLILSFVLSILIIAFHTSTLTILFKIKVDNLKGSQKYLMISLFIVELALGVVALALSITSTLDIQKKIEHFLVCLDLTFLYLMYLFLMALITVDRLLEFKLNIKYPLYWTPRRTVYTIVIFLVTSFMIFLFTFISNELNRWNYFKVFFLYIYATYHVLFLMLASFTYFIIFKKIRNNRKQKVQRVHQSAKRNRNDKTTRIFLPTLIIVTFLLFDFIPGIIFSAKSYHHSDQTPYVNHFIGILYILGWLLDPAIYIFSLKSVRVKIRKTLSHRCNVPRLSSKKTHVQDIA